MSSHRRCRCIAQSGAPAGLRPRPVAESLECRALLADAYQTAFAAQPTTGVAGAPISLTVVLVSVNGALVPTADADVTLSAEGLPASFIGGTSEVAAVDGVATFDDVVLATAGNYFFEADSPGLVARPSGLISIVPAAAASLNFVDVPTTLTAGEPFTPQPPYGDPVSVTVVDQFDNLIATPTRVTVTTSDGKTTETVTTSQGTAYFENVVVDRAGQATLTATSPGLPTVTSAPFTVQAAGVVTLAFTAMPTQLVAGQAWTGVTVVTLDAFGNVSDGADTAPLLMSLSGSAGRGTSASADVSVGNGQATALAGQAPTVAGTYTVTVSANEPGVSPPPLTPVTSQPFAVVAGPAAGLSLSGLGSPTYASAGQAIGPLIVTPADAYGNPAAIAEGTIVTVALIGATLDGVTSVAAHDGAAGFAGLSIPTEGTYTLTATEGALTGTDAITVRPPLLTSIETVAGRSVGTLTINVAAYFPLLGSQKRSGSLYLQLDSLSHSAFHELIGYAPIVHGFAGSRVPALRTAGTYAIGVYDSAGESASVEFTVASAAPARLTFEPVVQTHPGGALTAAVHLFDRFGNPVTNDAGLPVTLTYAGPDVNGVKPSLGGVATVSVDDLGEAYFTGLTLPAISHARLRATVHGVPPVLSAPFNTG